MDNLGRSSTFQWRNNFLGFFTLGNIGKRKKNKEGREGKKKKKGRWKKKEKKQKEIFTLFWKLNKFFKKKNNNCTDSRQKWHHWIIPLIWEVVGQNQWFQSLNASCQDKNHKLLPQFRGAPGVRFTIILLNLWILHRSRFPLLPITSSLPGSLAFCGSSMAPHSSTLAWKIPWTEEPGGLQSMGLQRVGHDWATSLSLFTFMHGRRKWWPTPVFLPGESQGRGSLVGCHLWGHTESDTTEVT